MGRPQPARLGHGPDRGEVERAQPAQPVPPLGAVHGSGELGRTDELAARGRERRGRVTITPRVSFSGCGYRAISSVGNRLQCMIRRTGSMATVEMYSPMWCPHCGRARALLE